MFHVYHINKKCKITFSLFTGSQFDVMLPCSLKLPSNVSAMSCNEKAHTAEPPIALFGVVKIP